MLHDNLTTIVRENSEKFSVQPKRHSPNIFIFGYLVKFGEVRLEPFSATRTREIRHILLI